MPPKRVRTGAVALSDRETRLKIRKRGGIVAATARSTPTVDADQSMTDMGTNVGQIGALVKSVLEGLVPAVEAAVRQQCLPAPVASDNRNPSNTHAPSVEPSVFDGTDGFGPEGNVEGHSYGTLSASGLNVPSFSRLRARAQALEYIELSEFLLTESKSPGHESFSLQPVNGVLTVRSNKPKISIRNMIDWGRAWGRFMEVMIEKFPELGVCLSKYMTFIFSLANEYRPSELAIAYDRAFRQDLGITCSPAYHPPRNMTIWLGVFRTAPSAFCGLCSSRSHSTENCPEIGSNSLRFKSLSSAPREDLSALSVPPPSGRARRRVTVGTDLVAVVPNTTPVVLRTNASTAMVTTRETAAKPPFPANRLSAVAAKFLGAA
jgi:hypothetical protein